MSNSSNTENKFAEGPDTALQRAIDVLGPYPWKRPTTLRFQNWIVDLPELVNREAMYTEIRKIGRHYSRDLLNDLNSPRSKNTSKKFKVISTKAAQLAGLLQNLTHVERALLNEYFQPGQDPKLWVDLIFNQLPPAGFPTDPGLPNGPGVRWLEYVSEHASAATEQFAPYNKNPGATLAAGRPNSYRLKHAPPSWNLIKMCWQLFEWAPHRKPSATLEKALHSFVCDVHEWVTGQVAVDSHRFEAHLKQFARPWKRQMELYEEFDSLIHKLSSSDEDILIAVVVRGREELKDRLPPKVVAKGKK